ncbi:hypothetical protein [Pseudomonas sp. 5P_3.1_Bac2]|uniref:hypothetical protein n=1 Tax=Pseudomonas sp. 5P_3.1_Bac2 TaxID=2971617 RepID=UPI0021C7A1B5|nr:hypothetical protein [Pseudomonas sp. 5P_3.1_Bac2]MCU1717941.1 hypothetical protein [Pseudomonas sp. 5P_3.1_Bac2]
MEAKKGKYGLWYVDGTSYGFSSEQEALAHLKSEAELKSAGEKMAATAQLNRAHSSNGTDWNKTFLGHHWLEWVLGCVMAGGFMYVFAWITSDTPPEVLAAQKIEKAERECKSTYGHQAISQRLITNQMKSPSTAKVTSQNSVYMGDCRVMHNGYIDAQNSFGVYLQQNYTAITIYNKDSDTFTLESLEM